MNNQQNNDAYFNTYSYIIFYSFLIGIPSLFIAISALIKYHLCEYHGFSDLDIVISIMAFYVGIISTGVAINVLIRYKKIKRFHDNARKDVSNTL